MLMQTMAPLRHLQTTGTPAVSVWCGVRAPLRVLGFYLRGSIVFSERAYEHTFSDMHDPMSASVVPTLCVFYLLIQRLCT